MKSFYSDAQSESAVLQTPFIGLGEEFSAHKNVLFGAHHQRVPKAHHPSAEHQKPHSKQNGDSTTSYKKAGGIRYFLK